MRTHGNPSNNVFLVLTTFLVFTFVSLASPTVSGKNPGIDWKERGYDIPELEMLIHDGINIERKKHGLTLLKWNADLNMIARNHNADMVKRIYFSHSSPDGDRFQDRYKKAGFTCSIKRGYEVFAGAENISQDNLIKSIRYQNNVPSYQWNSIEEIARSVVTRWMESPPHRKNILFPYWKSEGMGIVITDEGKVLVTQNFC